MINILVRLSFCTRIRARNTNNPKTIPPLYLYDYRMSLHIHKMHDCHVDKKLYNAHLADLPLQAQARFEFIVLDVHTGSGLNQEPGL